jgi:hypothetical protein
MAAVDDLLKACLFTPNLPFRCRTDPPNVECPLSYLDDETGPSQNHAQSGYPIGPLEMSGLVPRSGEGG